MKKYNQSPLPFQGQKRRFLKQFKQGLNEFSPQATYIDLFGGSGLLAHTVKYHYPKAKVIWNDYDNFTLRLKNIEATNALLCRLRQVLSGYLHKTRIEEPYRSEVLRVVRDHEFKNGYLDYITLSSQVLFSGKYKTDFASISSETMYNRIKSSEYDATGYLQGVERVQDDYRAIYNEYKSNREVVWLIDPPYLSTDTASYNKADYWRLRDYLVVLSLLDGSNYFYFTSNKSQIIELCQWIETRTLTGNPFTNATMNTTGGNVNFSSSYTDIMIYKKA